MEKYPGSDEIPPGETRDDAESEGQAHGIPLMEMDNGLGSQPIETTDLPRGRVRDAQRLLALERFLPPLPTEPPGATTSCDRTGREGRHRHHRRP